MASSRRVFLEVVGVGAAGATVNAACVGFVDDGALPRADGVGGARMTQTGGTGGATGAGGAGLDGAGGSRPGTGGSAPGAGGARGVGGQGGTAARDAGADLPRDTGIDTRDSGPATRDAGPVLGPGDITAGNVSGLATGALNAIAGSTVAIGRDAMGVYALTLVCTHQGCTAAPAGATGARQINCPCHGSQFDRNGAVIRGPAGRPLVHFAVTIDAGGNIVVHTNTQVAATVRA
jgi:Rieske Fe-S protein